MIAIMIAYPQTKKYLYRMEIEYTHMHVMHVCIPKH